MWLIGLTVALLSASGAFAQNGSGGNPYFVRQQQGKATGGGPHTCSTVSSVLIEGDDSRRSWVCRMATGETETIYICCDALWSTDSGGVPTPTPVACTSGARKYELDPVLPSVFEDDTAQNRCTCLAASGSAVLVCKESKK